MLKRTSSVMALILVFVAAGCVAEGSAASNLIETMTFEALLHSPKTDVDVDLSEVASLKQKLWEKYCTEQRADAKRAGEHQSKRIEFNGKVMRYEYSSHGEAPEKGHSLYIALHGGGGAPPQVNDRGWNHMKVYYRDGVKEGIYLAPRGISDTWNLHFQGDSYLMYDRVIENMILFEGVDPDRVYLLGFSAGGDGVYQVTPRMADRFAAANMSAGHPNNTNMKNLYNVPFLIQVGEFDKAYGRNTVSIDYYRLFNKLREEYGGGYVNEFFMHANRGHGFLDNHPQGEQQVIIADPLTWNPEQKERKGVKRDTHAVTWLSQYTRNPLPERVVWDLTTRANRSGAAPEEGGTDFWLTRNRGNAQYWLEIDPDPAKLQDVKEIDVVIDKAGNALRFMKTAPLQRVLLSQGMLDLGKPVSIVVDSQTVTFKPRPNLRTMVRTLADRGDANYIFEAEVALSKTDETTWKMGI